VDQFSAGKTCSSSVITCVLVLIYSEIMSFICVKVHCFCPCVARCLALPVALQGILSTRTLNGSPEVAKACSSTVRTK
jgi:hypothetical protein